MFTGIVEEIGTIQAIEKGEKSSKLTILAEKVLDDLKYGDSVATDGVCLTVSELHGKTFVANFEKSSCGKSCQSGASLAIKHALRRTFGVRAY